MRPDAVVMQNEKVQEAKNALREAIEGQCGKKIKICVCGAVVENEVFVFAIGPEGGSTCVLKGVEMLQLLKHFSAFVLQGGKPE